MKLNTSIFELKNKLYSFFVCLFLFLLLHYFSNVLNYPYDSGVYWHYAISFDAYENDSTSIRGYFFSFFLKAGLSIFNIFNISPIQGFRIFSSIFYAYVFSIQFPNIFLKIFGGYNSFYRRIFPSVLIIIIFPGFIVYPLSDLPAIAFAWTALYFFFISIKNENNRRFFTFLSGFFISAAYNTRSIYLFLFLFLMLAFLFCSLNANSKKNIFYIMLLYLFGFALVAIPQSIYNFKKIDTFSISPTAPYDQKSGLPLFLLQLNVGINTQKYETNLSAEVPPSIHYLNPEADLLLKNIQRINSFEHYFNLALNNPFIFCKIYFRHLINGLDVKDGYAYISSSPYDRYYYGWISFIVFTIGFLIFVLSFSNKKISKNELLFILLAFVPVFAIIPGMTETRFYLPLHLFSHLALAMKFDFGLYKNLSRKQIFYIFIFFLSASLLFYNITTKTLESKTVYWKNELILNKNK